MKTKIKSLILLIASLTFANSNGLQLTLDQKTYYIIPNQSRLNILDNKEVFFWRWNTPHGHTPISVIKINLEKKNLITYKIIKFDKKDKSLISFTKLTGIKIHEDLYCKKDGKEIENLKEELVKQIVSYFAKS